MFNWGTLFFLSLVMTSLIHSPNVSAKERSKSIYTANSQLRGYNSNYYCKEFSINPPTRKNWRDYMMAELSPEKYPLFFEDNPGDGAPSDLIKFCPNYPNLNVDQKKIILMRLFDGMVFFESTCNETAKGRGPNGIANGVLQLHLGREDDYAKGCRQYDSRDPKRSFSCSLKMLHDQVNNSNRIFSSGSYWEVLRPLGRSNKATAIANHLWYYPLCHKMPKD